MKLNASEADRLRLADVRTETDMVEVFSDTSGQCDAGNLKHLGAASLTPEARLQGVSERLVDAGKERERFADAPELVEPETESPR